MRKFICLILLLLGSCPVWAEQLPVGVQNGYVGLTRAWLQRDADAVLAQFTPDAEIIDGRRRLLKHEDIEKLVRTDLQNSDRCKIQYKVLKWVKKDGHIEVNSHQDRLIQYPTKRVRRVSERKDTWAKDSKGRWKVSHVLFVTQNAWVEMDLVRPEK